MKKTKFAVLFTALVAMLGLSSCLGEPDPIQGWAEYVRVSGGLMGYNFIDVRKNVITPTNQSAISTSLNASYAYIAYNYDTTIYDLNSDREVELTGLLPIETKYLTPSLQGMDDFSNAPISSVSTQFAPVFWDVNNMFLPIYYFVKQYSDETDMKNEFNSHSFGLYYDNSVTDGIKDGQLVLYLRHNVSDDSLNKERSASTYGMYHYDLTYAISDFKNRNGENPKEIVIKFKQNIYNSDYSEGYVTDGEYLINYTEVLESYNQAQ